MGRKRTHDEFVSDMETINPNIEIIGSYIDNRTHITVKCLRHGTIWGTMPQTLYLGGGCEQCRVEKISKASRFKHEDFIKAVEVANPNVEILGEYQGRNRQIETRCKIHNIVWYPRPDSILDGRGCPDCANIKRSNSIAIPEEEVLARIEKTVPTAKLIGKYINTSERAKFHCSVCGHIWNPIVNTVLAGHGYKKCGFAKISENTRLSNDEFIERLKKINPTIKPLETYVTSKSFMRVECTLCGRIWKSRPTGLLEGNGCAACTSSRGERSVRATLDELKIEYSQEHIFLDCRNKWPLRYDFYIPSLRLAIEFQGRQHYEVETKWGGDDGLAERQLRDQIKRDYCAANNIHLVEIPYWEIKQVPNLVKELINPTIVAVSA
jgi:hypothetical protein